MWLIIIVLGLLAGANLNAHLTTSLSVPGTQSASADRFLAAHFDENIEGTFTVLYKFNNASTDQISEFERQIAIAAKVVPTERITQEKALGGTLVVNIGTSLNLAKAATFTNQLRAVLKSSGMSKAMVTGPPAIESDVTPILSADLHRGELIATSIALLLLLLLFGLSWSIFIPFIIAAGSISAAISIIFLISQKFLVVLYIPNIVELIGLGLAIDYSLLMINRFRRELETNPLDTNQAIVITMRSAGKVVAISGITVALALMTLILIPIPFVRSLGIASLLVPLSSIAAAFTLQPALLSFVGKAGAKRKFRESFFTNFARIVTSRPKLISLSALGVLLLLSFSVLTLHLTPSSLTAVPNQVQSQRALNLVEGQLGSGVITPNEIVIDLGAPRKTNTSEIIKARILLSDNLLKNPEVLLVATGTKPPYADSSGRYLRLFVIGRHSFGAPESQNLVRELRTDYLIHNNFPIGTSFYLGGAAAQGVDLLHVLSHSLPWIILLALLFTYLLLLRAFRSLILPLKAIALDIVSLAAAYGMVVFAFRSESISHLFGIYHLNQSEAWAMVFLFVLLFGISMDYEVFIISRMREAKDRGLSNLEAIEEGISETGPVVTTAALIFIGAVSGLALGHFAGLQELGIGLGFGVLVDAVIIRGLLLPSVMVLLGRWNWWLPVRIARIIKTSPTPLHEVRG
jgi:RND superfamily putative drug exporter